MLNILGIENITNITLFQYSPQILFQHMTCTNMVQACQILGELARQKRGILDIEPNIVRNTMFPYSSQMSSKPSI